MQDQSWQYIPFRWELLNIEGLAFLSILLFLAIQYPPETRRDPLEMSATRRLLPPTLLAVALTTLFCAQWGTAQFLLASALALCVVYSLRQPVAAVCILISVLMLRPWEVLEKNSVMDAVPRLFAGITLGSLIAHRARREPFRFVWNLSCTALVALCGWLLLSTMKSSDASGSIDLFLDLFPKYLIVFFLTVNVVKSARDLRVLSGCLLLALCGTCWLALYRTINDPTVVDSAERLKAIGLFENANDAAALAVIVLPLAGAFAGRRRESPVLRLIAGFCAGTALLVIWYAQSRGALMGAMAALGAFQIARIRRLKPSTVLGVALCLSVPITMNFRRDAGEAEASTQNRINYWIAGWRMAVHNPLLGVGFGNYPTNYEHYSPQIDEWGKRTAHSTWILLMAEAGFPGLFFFAVLFFSVLRDAWRIRAPAPEFFCAMVGYGVAMSFLSHTYFIYVYVLLAMVLTARRALTCADISREEKIHPWVTAKKQSWSPAAPDSSAAISRVSC